MSRAVLQLFPELTDVNGDAQNALVLAMRARWAGRDAHVEPVAAERPLPQRPPLAVVLGSGVDAALERTRDALRLVERALESWISAGVPILAVGTGMELLGRSIAVDGRELEGIGLLPLVTEALPARVTDDLVVTAPEGELVGYENHARGVVLDAGAEPFARVRFGTGDGQGTDGVRHRSVVGTRLHGPVLAKNPALADALLEAAFGESVVVTGPVADQADAAAAEARRLTLAGIGR